MNEFSLEKIFGQNDDQRPVCWALLGGTVSQYVAHPPALVAGLRPGVGAVLDDVADLVAVVAGVFLLSAVPGDVARAVTLVAAVLLLAALRQSLSCWQDRRF